METDFVDIRIVGLEEEMMVESPVNPSLFYIFLKLSQTPPPIWQSYFKDSRKVSRHPRWRNAWIDRKFIVVECMPEEIEKYHLNDLKQDVAQANQNTHKYFQGQSRTQIQKESVVTQERDRLREMKGRLKFD